MKESTRLLRKLRGRLFRASKLLDQPTDPWQRRRLLDALSSHGERIDTAGGAILRLRLRVPYRDTESAGGLVFPGNAGPRAVDLPAMARLARQPAIAKATPGRLAVIDTETTGLLDKPETVPFLVGLGRFGSKAFALEQYFLEDFESEPGLMQLLERRVRDFRAILSYNGGAFDLPLLRRRFAVHRLSERTWTGPHWDVLTTARWLWRGRTRTCSLTDLERAVFDFERARDIETHRIPEAYIDYLGDRRAERLAAVFDHNAQDVLTTAAVALTLARALRNPRRALARGIADANALDRFLAKAGVQ